jgi:signal transduction histidine kinase
MLIAIAVLTLVLAVSVSYSVLLKKDIAQMNKTLRQISKSDTNLELSTFTFDTDIEELTRTINEILKREKNIRRSSEKANTELRRTITNISHDLRTPLTSVLGYVQMMRGGKTPEAKKAEYLAIVESRLQALTALQEELFEFTQITEGHTVLQQEKVNICNILTDTISDFYDEFTQRQIAPHIEIPSSAVYADCDGKALKRIIQNLLKNMLVHGSGNFRIAVQADELAIVFENSVANIGDLDVERLFDRFYTADASRSGKNTGLGLAIAKELTERMGGKISANVSGDLLAIKIQLQ